MDRTSKHVRFFDQIGDGDSSGGGGAGAENGTSKAGARCRIGGLGDECDEQAGGQGQWIEADDRKGGTEGGLIGGVRRNAVNCRKEEWALQD